MLTKLVINTIDPFYALESEDDFANLNSDFLHIYAASISGTTYSDSHLTSGEILKRNRFQQQSDKDRFGLGRFLIRSILPKYQSNLPPLFELDFTSTNKPFLPNSAIQFNLAHSGNWVVLAVSNKSVGIDIELIKPISDIEEVMKVCFNTIEIEAISNSVYSLKSFYKFWTGKEAILKTTGQGIATNLLAINVLEGEDTLLLEKGQSPIMYLNSYEFKSEYIISIGSELGLVPLQIVLE